MINKLSYVLLSSLILTGCSSKIIDEEIKSESTEDRKYRGLGKALGDDTLTFGGGRKKDVDDTGLGVNSHLWRASLDTISFMPLTSADPFGGVILTDWYSPQGTPDERFKVNVYILDRQLRSDGLKVSVFRQAKRNGQWVNQSVDDSTSREMENTILVRARGYRAQKA